MILDPADRPPAPACPSCRAMLTYVDSDASFDAFRAKEAPVRQTPVHHYDCERCRRCWKLGAELESDPIRQVLKGDAWASGGARPTDNRVTSVDLRESSRLLIGLGLVALPSTAFILAAIFELNAPRGVYTGRQWLVNGISMVLGYGALLSLFCAPLSLLATIFNFKRLTPRDRIIASILALLAGGGPLLIALYFLAISQIR